MVLFEKWRWKRREWPNEKPIINIFSGMMIGAFNVFGRLVLFPSGLGLKPFLMGKFFIPLNQMIMIRKKSIIFSDMYALEHKLDEEIDNPIRFWDEKLYEELRNLLNPDTNLF